MIIQGSPEWHQQRLGKVTASKVADVTARTKTGWGATRATYMAQLIAERLTGQPTEFFTNAAMQWGTETEPQARAAYTLETGAEVQEVAFIDHPHISMSGASPDGLVGSEGMIEIKCPNTATHLESMLGAEIDGRYIKQMQWQMACTGRQWCDFVSFDPRMPYHLQLKITRVKRDEKLIEEYAADIVGFLKEIDEKMGKLERLAA
jgi:putative phage-type endonuclease